MKLVLIPLSSFSWARGFLLPHPLPHSCRPLGKSTYMAPGYPWAPQRPATSATCYLAPAAGVILWDEGHGELIPWWPCLWCVCNKLPESIRPVFPLLARSMQMWQISSTATVVIPLASAATIFDHLTSNNALHCVIFSHLGSNPALCIVLIYYVPFI